MMSEVLAFGMELIPVLDKQVKKACLPWLFTESSTQNSNISLCFYKKYTPRLHTALLDALRRRLDAAHSRFDVVAGVLILCGSLRTVCGI